jgi:hypothetical protein
MHGFAQRLNESIKVHCAVLLDPERMPPVHSSKIQIGHYQPNPVCCDFNRGVFDIAFITKKARPDFSGLACSSSLGIS